MQEFMDKNPTFQLDFPEVHSTLICDDLHLSAVPRRAYKSLADDGLLEKKKANSERITNLTLFFN